MCKVLERIKSCENTLKKLLKPQICWCWWNKSIAKFLRLNESKEKWEL